MDTESGNLYWESNGVEVDENDIEFPIGKLHFFHERPANL